MFIVKIVHIYRWNPEDGKQIAELAKYGGEAFKLLVAGGQLFSTSADRIARQHQVEDRKEVRQFSGHTDWPISLAASVEAKRLCAGCFDGRIGVWSLESKVSDGWRCSWGMDFGAKGS